MLFVCSLIKTYDYLKEKNNKLNIVAKDRDWRFDKLAKS